MKCGLWHSIVTNVLEFQLHCQRYTSFRVFPFWQINNRFDIVWQRFSFFSQFSYRMNESTEGAKERKKTIVMNIRGLRWSQLLDISNRTHRLFIVQWIELHQPIILDWFLILVVAVAVVARSSKIEGDVIVWNMLLIITSCELNVRRLEKRPLSTLLLFISDALEIYYKVCESKCSKETASLYWITASTS